MGKTELTEKFDRRENLRGTALTIMGGIFWGLAGVWKIFFCIQRNDSTVAGKCKTYYCRNYPAYGCIQKAGKGYLESMEK